MKGTAVYHSPFGKMQLDWEAGAVTALRLARDGLCEGTPNALTARVFRQLDACRAVGMANHANPILIVIPCHRVICADGSPGGYAGGAEMKKALLRLEQAGEA